MTKRVLDINVNGYRSRGRPKIKWINYVKDVMDKQRVSAETSAKAMGSIPIQDRHLYKPCPDNSEENHKPYTPNRFRKRPGQELYTLNR